MDGSQVSQAPAPPISVQQELQGLVQKLSLGQQQQQQQPGTAAPGLVSGYCPATAGAAPTPAEAAAVLRRISGMTISSTSSLPTLRAPVDAWNSDQQAQIDAANAQLKAVEDSLHTPAEAQLPDAGAAAQEPAPATVAPTPAADPAVYELRRRAMVGDILAVAAGQKPSAPTAVRITPSQLRIAGPPIAAPASAQPPPSSAPAAQPAAQMPPQQGAEDGQQQDSHLYSVGPLSLASLE